MFLEKYPFSHTNLGASGPQIAFWAIFHDYFFCNFRRFCKIFLARTNAFLTIQDPVLCFFFNVPMISCIPIHPKKKHSAFEGGRKISAIFYIFFDLWRSENFDISEPFIVTGPLGRWSPCSGRPTGRQPRTWDKLHLMYIGYHVHRVPPYPSVLFLDL